MRDILLEALAAGSKDEFEDPKSAPSIPRIILEIRLNSSRESECGQCVCRYFRTLTLRSAIVAHQMSYWR